jgi:hypothetical protein
MAFLPTNASQVQQFAIALYGIQVGTATMAAVQQDITNVGGLNKALNAYYAASFGSSTTAVVAASVATNLGLTGTAATDAAAYITAVLNGTAASARGEAIMGVLSLFSTLTANATFGAAATTWNTKVAAAIAYTGAADTAIVAGAEAVGQAFTLTIGADTIVGTAGNDTIKASTGLSADGSADIKTTNALDSVDGGAGVDTFVIENTGGKNTLVGTFKNVENLTFVGAGKINNDVDVASTDFSGTIKFDQTDVWFVGQKVTGLKAQTVALNKVADLTIATLAYDAAQTSATVVNTGAVANASVSLSGTKIDTVNVTSDKTATSKKLTVTDSGNTTKTFNITGTDAAAVEVESTSTEAINISGSGLVTLTTTTTAPTKTLSSVNSTGGVVYATELPVGVVFTGGAGKDSVSFGATTKAQTLGAGDDTATISSDLGTGGSIDAGEGTGDTLKMTATLAATLDNDDKFNAKVSGFEKLSLTAATTQTVDLTNLDGLNYVKEAGNGSTLTVNNFTSGGTLEFSDQSTTTAVSVKDASTGTADVFNVKLSAAATFAAGTLTASDIETININSDDTATAPASDGSVKHTLTLTADKATKINVSGDASLNLTLTNSTKVTAIDASAATSGLTTDLSVASGITLTGSAKADTVTLGQLSVVTGGAGKDAYTVTANTNANTYSTITDIAATETIQFTDRGAYAAATLGTKLSLGSTAAFADYVQAAAAGATAGVMTWFQYGGDTYVVNDGSATAAWVNGTDEIVKLTGTLDLSKATISDAGLFTYVAA